MKHYDTTFFCNKGEGPKAALSHRFTRMGPDQNTPWPITFEIKADYGSNTACFHIGNESDFIAFKNSVIEMYNEYRKIMGYTVDPNPEEQDEEIKELLLLQDPICGKHHG